MSANHAIGAMNKLADALDNAGFDASDVTRLTQYEKLSSIRQLLDGNAEIVQLNHIIDGDADPFIPNGWNVAEHCKIGQMQWDAEKISLYLSKKQLNGGVVVGNKLRNELEKKQRLNANVLDYLLANPHLIPEAWKGKWIFFWGTIYRYSAGHLSVRCLYWSGDRWLWHDGWPGRDFDVGNPAALLAS